MFELARQLSARIFRNQAKPDAGIFFHDEYQNYEPEAKNNNAEILSAQSCADFIAGSKYKKTNFDFLELIIGQRRPETASKEARIFADIDYAILGDMYNYGTYAMQIRREYKQFNDDEFRKGRIDFIESLLKQPRIYQTVTSTSFGKKMPASTFNAN